MMAMPAPVPAPNEYQISSVLVNVHQQHLNAAAEAIVRIPGAEVAASELAAKLVVVMEAPSLAALTQMMDNINALDGVVNTTLVYHHVVPASELDELIEVDIDELP
jgi:nitrate reductase NapD